MVLEIGGQEVIGLGKIGSWDQAVDHRDRVANGIGATTVLYDQAYGIGAGGGIGVGWA